MSEVFNGPIKDKTVILHLDAAIPRDVQQAIMAQKALQDSPHATQTLGVNKTWWFDQHDQTVMSGNTVVHLVLFLADPSKYLKSLWVNWEPKNLLFFSLAHQYSSNILTNDALTKVEKLAFIGNVRHETFGKLNTMCVFTFLPFTSGTPILLGEWNSRKFNEWGELFTNRFTTFEGYQFELATWPIDKPFLYMTNSSGINRKVGVSVEMLDALTPVLNFTYTMITSPPDLKWGVIENDSWRGLLGLINQNEKNFTVNSLHLTADRNEDFDSILPYLIEDFKAFIPFPEARTEYLIVLQPFHPLVWVVIAATFIVALAFMTLQGPGQKTGVADTCLYLLRGLFAQSLPAHPRQQRMFISVWYLCCLVLGAAYTCNLIAIFTSPRYPQRIDTLQQLADSDYR
ncbi:glutamate receptor ionotropic, delta-2-like [Procambarus clarkii]|uniref:glutamate receptor ionotropic, delta-2-like n=1 Tax=Procambarus clarkii TaxID=6728 RepID=UPI0037426523